MYADISETTSDLHFLCMLPMALVARSSSVCGVICNLLPVLWMTSCLPAMGSMEQTRRQQLTGLGQSLMFTTAFLFLVHCLIVPSLNSNSDVQVLSKTVVSVFQQPVMMCRSMPSQASLSVYIYLLDTFPRYDNMHIMLMTRSSADAERPACCLLYTSPSPRDS